MEHKTNVQILSRLVFYIIFITIWLLLDIEFNDFPNSLFKVGACGALASILSPRINKINTQSGNKIQLKWVFFKKSWFF